MNSSQSLWFQCYVVYNKTQAAKKAAKKAKKEGFETPKKPSQEDEETPAKEKVCFCNLNHFIQIPYLNSSFAPLLVIEEGKEGIY